MKALVLYGPERYKVEQNWEMPLVPAGWALVRVAYAGICGSDIPRFFTTGSYHHPMIIGHEFSGVVEKSAKLKAGTPVAVMPIIPCGECEGCVKTGQPFHCSHYQFLGSRNDGGFAEYAAVPDENLLPLDSPEELKTGAMIEPIAVALHVIRRSGVVNGKAVVFGAGPIGLLCAMWLKFLSVDVTVVDIREYSLNIANKLGLRALHTSELSDKAEFDYSYEASGSAEALLKCIDVTKDLGVITVVGRNSKDSVIPVKQFEKLMRKELKLVGCWGYNIDGEEALIREFIKGCDLSVMISHLFPLEQVSEHLETLVRPHGEYCKLLIDMR